MICLLHLMYLPLFTLKHFSVSAQAADPQGIAFNVNGTKMFVVSFTVDSVSEYNLSTGFDVSTASYSQSFTVAAQETTPTDVSFNANGTKMFILGSTGDACIRIRSYQLALTYLLLVILKTFLYQLKTHRRQD
jgi:hypothetical protein